MPGDEPEGVVWIPILEVMQRLGAPRLRDPSLVSTLLMLVSALGGYSQVMAAYAAAVAGDYRFYSYGDAMAVVGPRGDR